MVVFKSQTAHRRYLCDSTLGILGSRSSGNYHLAPVWFIVGLVVSELLLRRGKYKHPLNPKLKVLSLDQTLAVGSFSGLPHTFKPKMC